MERVARGDRVLGFIEGQVYDGIVYHFTPNLAWIELLQVPEPGSTKTRSQVTAIIDRRHSMKV